MACYMPSNDNESDDNLFKRTNFDFHPPFGSTSQSWNDDKSIPKDIQELMNTMNGQNRFGEFPHYMAGNANKDGKTNSSKGKSNKEIHVNIEAGFRAFIKLPIGTVIKGDELNKYYPGGATYFNSITRVDGGMQFDVKGYVSLIMKGLKKNIYMKDKSIAYITETTIQVLGKEYHAVRMYSPGKRLASEDLNFYFVGYQFVSPKDPNSWKILTK